MRTVGKLVVATAAALLLAAPVANAAPAGGLPTGGLPGAGNLLAPVTQLISPLLGGGIGG
ncbi:hypothetical protein [Saccharothrix variisporea]|uniref:Small secreted domain DUF320 n=1 Tax=Saccharothrix variisporea TaxID=543527 RepID=A0A495X3E9_9PSEU|nr:hypothetical protein [Saccharothrix variisporea]RKT67745.1 hypothetical protein DFJ66_0921 [Saccharothrix variisporea]